MGEGTPIQRMAWHGYRFSSSGAPVDENTDAFTDRAILLVDPG